MNQPLTSTLADLTAQMIVDYYPVPTPGVPLVAPSTDSGVYMGQPDYLKLLNEQSLQKYAVDLPNGNAHAKLDFAARNWERNKSATSIPRPGQGGLPAYVVFDQAAFGQWWNQFNANLGAGAPPLYFIKPAALPPEPVIVGATPPPPAPSTDGPIGEPVPGNPGVFASSANDNYPDNYVYTGPTGIYQKHIYSNPFTPGYARIVWIALQQFQQAA